ncbi:MAG: glucose-6-phosphate dehydrogenase [Deltaproteobacteria bacterium]|nr:glucose-6-phosphate dehydrogenase [Deltaproteobacteria bacterium]
MSLKDDKYRNDPPQTIRIGKIEPTGEPCEEFYPGPAAMIIFGASGDLARRKIMPALFKLTRSKILTENFFIMGMARTEMDSDSFRRMIEAALREAGGFDEAIWERFSKKLYYKTVDYTDIKALEEAGRLIAEKERAHGTNGNRIFYLATPPSVYEGIIESIKASGLSGNGENQARVVIEKPSGRDLESARALDSVVLRNFTEEQVFRIDHYLGKETVQNILMLRFANAIFEPLWNRRYIDHVQITVAETNGIEKRAGYYEQAGVLRDMFQNHILQVLALAAMEPPSIYDPELVRDEKIKVLRALRPVPLNEINNWLVLGQYVEGEVDGRLVPGYREEEGVAKDSEVPTYAAMKLFIDNWRWQDVPFYIRSGKRLNKRFSEVAIQFKSVPHRLFRETLKEDIGPNTLILKIQPEERIQLRFHTKNPGSRVCLRDVFMDFSYTEGYKGLTLGAYERVLLDCMLGDKTLFVRKDGAELSWAFLTPMLDFIESGYAGAPEVNLYRAGSSGPVEADKFITREGRSWRDDG